MSTAEEPDKAERALLEALQTPSIRDLFRIELVAWKPGAVTLGLDYRPELGHAPGWFQGAVTAAIAEYAAGLSGVTIQPGKDSATVEQTIHFTGSARGDRLVSVGRILSSARTHSVIAADVMVERGGDHHPCATLTMTMVHREPAELKRGRGAPA